MSIKDSFARTAPGISTRSELEARIAARATPTVEKHLTPGGWTSTLVRRQLDAANETRIKELNRTFGTAKAKLRDGYTKAQARGRASRDFGRAD